MSISPADAIKLLQPVTRNGTRVFVRSSDNQELMDAFDSWQASCNWKPANSESRKYPKLNWSGPKYSNNWETFEQCAYVEDGNPQISCILCLNLMQHPAINGNKSMNEHVEGASHRKKVAAYKRAMDVPEGNSIMDLLAKQGRTGTKVTSRNVQGDLPLKNEPFDDKKWHAALMIGFVSAYIPFATIKDLHFRLALRMLRHTIKLPSPDTLTRILAREYELVLKAICARLPDDAKVSLALDGWTSTNKYAVISVIAYWLDRAFNRQEVQLSFDECRGAHDGANLALHLFDVLRRFQLDTGRLLGITTDNASSNFTMARHLSSLLTKAGFQWDSDAFHISCMAHVIQLCLAAFMKELNVKQHEKYWGDVEADKNRDGGEKACKGVKTKNRIALFAKLPVGFSKMIEKQRRLAVIVNASPTRRDEYLSLQEGRELVAVTLTLDVKTRWNSTLTMLERAYRLRAYTAEWLNNHPEYSMLQTTNNEWRAIEYLMEILAPFRYYTLWMSKQTSVTIHLVIRIYNDLYDHFDKILKALKNKRTSWKVECRKAVKAARRKLYDYYSKLTPKTGLLMILAVCLDPQQKLSQFKRWDKEDPGRTNYTQEYRTAFLSYFESHYAPAADNNEDGTSRTGESTPSTPAFVRLSSRFIDSDDDDDDTFSAACSPSEPSNTARAEAIHWAINYIDSPRVKIDKGNLSDDELANPLGPTAYFPSDDMLSWWRVQAVTGGAAANALVRMARDIFSVMPHGVGVESSFSLGRNVISWRQHRFTAENLRNYIIVRQHHVKNRAVVVPPHAVDDNPEQLDVLNQRVKIEDHCAVATEIEVRLQRRKELAKSDGRIKKKPIPVAGFISDNDERSDDVDVEKLELTDAKTSAPRLREASSDIMTSFFQQCHRVNKRIRHPKGVKRLDRAQTDTEVQESDSEESDYSIFEDTDEEGDGDIERSDNDSDTDSYELADFDEDVATIPPPLRNIDVVIERCKPQPRERQFFSSVPIGNPPPNTSTGESSKGSSKHGRESMGTEGAATKRRLTRGSTTGQNRGTGKARKKK